MLVSRERLEELEQVVLAPYGFHSRDTRGRAHPESESASRGIFQRDRDRVLHTTAFRRLEYKTQVFVIYEGDYYRTRLTHTLEVAQIGRTVARALGAHEDLVEAVCLAHDLGHPPFGHAGEAALNHLMASDGGFDHNRHSLRIVTELERRFPEFPGLNLTWEVREGIVKHETEYDVSDAGEYDPELRGNMEAQIASAADEMAYTAHDLDDGLRSGLLEPSHLEDLRLWQRLRHLVGPAASPETDLGRHMLIRELIGWQVDQLLSQTAQALASSPLESSRQVQRLTQDVVEMSGEAEDETRELKEFLYEEMYRHPRVLEMQAQAEKTLVSLFGAYTHRPEALPPEVQDRISTQGKPRAVCDYIAGMTDRFAAQECERLGG